MEWTALARRQAGVVTRGQCRSTGLTDRQINRLVGNGHLRGTARRGVLVASAAPASAEQEFWRAVLSTGGVLSHFSAAECRQIRVTGAPPGVHVTVDPTRYVQPLPGVTVHRIALPADHRTQLARLPITTVTRTVLDCLGVLPMAQARIVLDRCLQQRQISAVDLVSRRANRPGNPQLARLHRELTGAASEAERVLHRLLRRAGITGWWPNYPVTVEGHRFQIDVAFLAAKIAVEVDGWAFHSDVERFRADRRRQNRLSMAGWTVVRFTWADLVERPDEVVRTIAGLLAATDAALTTA